MTYIVPPKPAAPKPHYVRVTDPVEIEAIRRAGLRDHVGMLTQLNADEPEWWAEVHSLRQFRGQKVEFDV